MAFFSSRSQSSGDNNSQRTHLSLHDIPPSSSKVSHSSSSKRTHGSRTDESARSSTLPVPIPPTRSVLSALDPSPSSSSITRPRHKSDSYSTKSRKSASRVPVPSESALLARDVSLSAQRVQASSRSPSASRKSSDGGSASVVPSTRRDLQRLMNHSGQSSSSLISTPSESEASNRARAKPDRADSSPSRMQTKSGPNSPRDSDMHKQRNLLRKKPSFSAKSILVASPPSTPSLHHSRSKANISSPTVTTMPAQGRSAKKPSSPVGLTPAGAVVAAYKQQEQRREKLASFSNDEDRPDLTDGEDPDATPYYTVFGSTLGKVIAVGGPDEDSWKLDYTPYDGRASAMRASTPGTPADSSGSSLRKLSRKVSGRFKKTGSEGEGSHEHGRPSLQDRRSASRKHVRRKSLGLSIDGFVDVKPAEHSANGSIPSAKNGAKWPSENSPSKVSEVSTGTKLWKLMKRISTGGLKEKYYESSPPPPVPALPKELQTLSQSLSSRQKPFEIRSEPTSPDTSKPSPHLSRFVQGRSSFSGSPHPSPISASFKNAADRSVPRPSTAGTRPVATSPPIHGRPSTTTRSSSPNSSDFASSRFWSRTRSTRSSVSSYGEELPPIPKPTLQLGQHIIAPSELYRLEREREEIEAIESPIKSTKSGRPFDTDVHAHDRSGEYVRPSLPIPPRRRNPSSASPTVTSFSDSEGYMSTSPPMGQMAMGLSEFGGTIGKMSNTTPPPRPPRSARRATGGAPTTTTTPAKTQPERAKSHDDVCRETVTDFGTFGSRSMNRRSEASASSNASTIGKAASPPSGSGCGEALSRSPLRFREMGSRKEGTVWTEKEKADRWDDLLEMSSKAGGTIHLGDGAGLLSDSVRLSAYSDLRSL